MGGVGGGDGSFCGGGVRRRMFGGVDGRDWIGGEEKENGGGRRRRRRRVNGDSDNGLTIMDRARRQEGRGGLAGGSGHCAGESERGEKAGGFWRSFSVG